MGDLTPTRDRPGLHISKSSPEAPARGSAVCHCGASATATGDAQVRLLVQGWEANHGTAHAKGGSQ
ncbi:MULTISPECIES: hypothetical protein [Streptomyces]|uniref:Uncharacterized protein n=1 Tax=Streptomyces koelreuteriae TaxID=2838015 RepID=A0ABX8FWL9_9ACTN|nr:MULTISPECIES: hypothetical protein [Streptomyces]QWB25610.1 hypothetical protein KJK29_25270 [Streptomyces koelreuteriae]UUA08659.1 hypothetical protein NNW98_25425 [Streptomyces koelreuteriae]UUA16264.1 hypothetical protein NNW99_25310 [Streptomyces sp. CRCS-T-1]